MSIYSSKFFSITQQFAATLAIVGLLLSSVSTTAFAQEAPAADPAPENTEQTESGEPENGGESTDTTGGESESGEATENDGGNGTDGQDAAATGEESEDGEAGDDGTLEDNNAGPEGADGSTDEDGETGTNPEVTESADGDTPGGGDGTDGTTEESGVDGEEGQTTPADSCDDITTCGDDTTDDTATDDGDQGSEGDGGTDGSGGGAEESEEPAEEIDPITVYSENALGDDMNGEDPEDITGSVDVNRARGASVETGEATAQGQLYSDVNSGDVRSEVDPNTIGDLDFYTFNATGSNEATVDNVAAIIADTGKNTADSSGRSDITTGDAYAALNIANVVNTNVVNSDGFLYLKNQIIQPNSSLDLSDFFFPDPDSVLAAADDCTLSSCIAEDIRYNFSQTNDAVVMNNAAIEAVSGQNSADGNTADIFTGNAYGAANVINIVNTNVIDSNYRFLTFNAMGDLDGDLLLPNQDLFTAFYSRPNGMTQAEDAEDVVISALATNNADINDNIDTFAESGANISTALDDAAIVTGNADAESNILNRVNQNIYGGDSMYLLIRVHGSWTGEVKGLPAGLDYMWTSEGVLIYNPEGEIAPSKILRYDIDSYEATFTNQNEVLIDNNIAIDAISGENEVTGLIGEVRTGNAVASANVMNLANTNIIGTNFALAVINIFGDFSGDVTFTQSDLTLSGSILELEPFNPGDTITYEYTVHNNSTLPATNVVLEQVLQNATVDGTATAQSVNLGDLDPGESVSTQLTAVVDSALAAGSTSVRAAAVVSSDEGDINASDNSLLLTASATDSSGDTDTGDTGSDGGNDDTSDTDGSDTSGSGNNTGGSGGGSSSSGSGSSGGSSSGGGGSSSGGGGSGGGGGSSSGDDRSSNKSDVKTKVVDRSVTEVDPTKPSQLVLSKTADVSDDEHVMAGQSVNYTVTVLNRGGAAYNAVLYDTLRNPIDAVMDEQSWELGTILPGEKITLAYTTTFSDKAPSGRYTNTAHIAAYRYPEDTDEQNRLLQVGEAVHVINIDGVGVGIGNVDTVAYFPGLGGKPSALISWETSTSSWGEVYYSPQRGTTSPYNPAALYAGYDASSVRFPNQNTRHSMIVTGLTPGQTYQYRIHADTGTDQAVSSEHTFSVPAVVARLLLDGWGELTPRIAGASYTAPVTTTPAAPSSPTPLPSSPLPAPSRVQPVAESAVPTPEPVQTPVVAESEETATSGSNGFFGTLFGIFR